MSLPSSTDLFAGKGGVALADQVEKFKGAVSTMIDEADRGDTAVNQVGMAGNTPAFELVKGARSRRTLLETAMAAAQRQAGSLEKGADPQFVSETQQQLEALKGVIADLQKDVTTTSPLSTGFVPFDLQAPAKYLIPVLTPFRNMFPRTQGQGLIARYKRITGITNSQTGGVGLSHPGIAETTQSNWNLGGGNNEFFLRPPKISYASDDQTRGYFAYGYSDQVSYAAQFTGMGFQDNRAVSQMSVLYASMLGEENMLVGGRGTGTSYLGALGTVSSGNVTLTVRNAGAGETGNTANIATLFVRVAAQGQWGNAIASAEVTTTGMSAATGKVVDVTLSTDTAGAMGYAIYAGTVTGAANQFFNGRVGFSTTTTGQGTTMFTIQFGGGGTGGAINTGATAPTSDGTAFANGYDGVYSLAMDTTNAGAVSRVNGTLSISNPGVEFQNIFTALYAGGVTGVLGSTAGGSGVKANPDAIWMHGQDRKQLSDAIKTTSSGSNYHINLNNGDNFSLGAVADTIVNEITGKPVQLMVQPWVVQGNAAVLSYTLPIPVSNVGNVWEVRNVQDYMGISWPQIQLSYDFSSYWLGTFLCYAPAWNGAVAGIKAV